MQLYMLNYDEVVKYLEAHPQKKIFWRAGYKWKGAWLREIVRDKLNYSYGRSPETWQECLRRWFRASVEVTVEKDTETEYIINGLDSDDMY